MATSFKSDLRKAYRTAKRELNDLLLKQQQLEKKIVSTRQTLQSLSSVCEAAGVRVESSSEAAYLLQKSGLGDEVRSILIGNYPAWTRPNQVVAELERIGHDLSKLSNPQASVQMILKRMVQSGEAQEGVWPNDGKKIYRVPRTSEDVTYPNVGMILANIPERGRMVPLSSLRGNTEFDVSKIPSDIREMLYGPSKR